MLFRPHQLVLVFFISLLLARWAGFSMVAAEDDRSVKIIHDTDLNADPKTGYGAFAWRPDSKAIAYVKWLSGRIGLLDVTTGHDFEIPDVQMNGVKLLAWSADGGMLALNSHTQLKIVRMSDYQVISTFDFFADNSQGSPRINQMAFAEDGRTLIFQNTNDGGKLINKAPPHFVPVILYSYDIESRHLTPLVQSPFGERRTLSWPNSAEFQRFDGKLYYTAMIQRSDELLKSGPRIVNHIDYENTATPSTCFVYQIDDAGGITSVRSMDFPEPGREVLDQSRDIFSCQYSPLANMLIVNRQEPYHFDADPPIEISKLGRFNEIFDLGNSNRVATIGQTSGLETNRFGLCSPHPTRKWCLTNSWSNPTKVVPPGASLAPGDKQFIRLWDMARGLEIARLELSQTRPKTEPLLSPDGLSIAFREASYSLPLFKIIVPKG